MVVPPVRARLRMYAVSAGRVPDMTPRNPAPAPTPQDAARAAAFLDSQEITTTGCPGCGTEISGVNGRYACACGWVNHWSEGHGELPTAADDPDARG